METRSSRELVKESHVKEAPLPDRSIDQLTIERRENPKHRSTSNSRSFLNVENKASPRNEELEHNKHSASIVSSKLPSAFDLSNHKSKKAIKQDKSTTNAQAAKSGEDEFRQTWKVKPKISSKLPSAFSSKNKKESKKNFSHFSNMHHQNTHNHIKNLEQAEEYKAT